MGRRWTACVTVSLHPMSGCVTELIEMFQFAHFTRFNRIVFYSFLSLCYDIVLLRVVVDY